MNELEQKLFSLQDEKYRLFQARLMPTIEIDRIIGIRTPILRKFAKDFAKTPEAEQFIKSLPHTYYEENNLHAFILETEKDFDKAIQKTEQFLPYIDNWATCDSFMPKAFKKNADKLIPKINEWIKSDRVYTVRYAVGLLMGLFLDERFKSEYLELAASVKSDEYYINMMLAWYFATALAKQYDDTIKFIKERRLDTWVHNKTIQKAVESYRISDETKTFLRTLKIK